MEKYSVLIVDDDEFLLDIYTTKFTQGGHDVMTASGGEDTLRLLEEGKKFDVILMDIVMPAMDGITLLKQIKEKKLAEGSCIIILSNQGQQSDIDKAKAEGVDGYIVKASTVPSEVLEEVMRITKNKLSSK